MLVSALLTGPATTCLQAEELGRLIPPGSKVLKDVEFAAPGGHSLKLNACIPPSDKPLPVLIWIHGGGWRAGDRGDVEVPLTLLRTAPSFAVVSIDYRLSQQAIFPAQIQDCVTAVRWVRANGPKVGIDPERIGVWGASAGAHLASLLGTSGDQAWDELGPVRIKAVCAWFGPADLADAAKPSVGFEQHAKADSGVSQLLGGPVASRLELAAKASPITYISADDPPFLLMYGDRDTIVPVDQGWRFQQALSRAGVKADLVVFGGAGHGGGDFMSEATMRRIAAFFTEHLR